MTILSILLVIAIFVIVCLLIEGTEKQADIEFLVENRNDFRQKFLEEKEAAKRLYHQRDEARIELDKQRKALDVIATKQRAAGIALGFVEPLEEVDDIPF